MSAPAGDPPPDYGYGPATPTVADTTSKATSKVRRPHAEAATTRGSETRKRILGAAVSLAAKEGLEALTIGRLAEALAMSKAGLFAHFGSKEELQLATVEAAREVFIDQVIRPALLEPAGVPRLVALCEMWLDYSGVMEGGCFFASASAEFDGRPGAVRDRIAAVMLEWLGAIERAVRDSQKLGHVREDVDARQIAFELNALAMGSNWARQLFRDASAVARARKAMVTRVEGISTAAGTKARATKKPRHDK